jgi:hypothetical protein
VTREKRFFLLSRCVVLIWAGLPAGAGTVQRFEDVVADRLIEVPQGETAIVEIKPGGGS